MGKKGQEPFLSLQMWDFLSVKAQASQPEII